MNRRAFGVDRVIAFLLGLVLLAGGLWVVTWAARLLPAGWWNPENLVVGLEPAVADTGWWAWLLLVGGLLLVAVGGAWFAHHFRRSTVDRLSMPGDAQGGRLVLTGDALSHGVAEALAEASPGIEGARAKLLDHRKDLVLEVAATVRPDADLRDVTRACERVSAQALRSSGRSDVTCRIQLRVASRTRPAVRAH